MTANIAPGRVAAARSMGPYGSYSRRAFARKTGISEDTLLRYETDGGRVSDEYLSRLVKASGFGANFFTTPLRSPITAHFRTPWTHYRVRTSAEGLPQLAVDLAFQIDTSLGLPPLDLPRFPLTGEWDRSPKVREAALSVRQRWGLDDRPIPNLNTVVEAAGIPVVFLKAPKTAQGFTGWLGDRPVIVCNHESLDAYQLRFTVAHELGHAVLEHHLEPVPEEGEAQVVQLRRQEAEANAFAAELLLPSTSATLRDALKGACHYRYFQAFLPIKEEWGARVEVLVRRALELELESPEDSERRGNDYVKAGMRRGEPGKRSEPEVVSMIPAKLRELLAIRADSWERIAAKTGIPVGFIEQLASRLPDAA